MSDETENEAFIAALFGGREPTPPAAETDPDAPPDFDGGPRDPEPEPEDPEAAHNAFMVALVQQANAGKLGGL
jgi:hypothetical protein